MTSQRPPIFVAASGAIITLLVAVVPGAPLVAGREAPLVRVPGADASGASTLSKHAAGLPGDTQRVGAADARKAAKSAQGGFERMRRRHLPFWNGPSGRCDEIVGRFCLWHDSESPFDPGPEKERVRAAREELIAALRAASRAAPGEWWIVGQWVRYLVEAGRLSDARAAAATCRAEAWWCGALAGYAHHAEGDFSAAEAAYELALRDMSVEESRRWRDLSYLLDGDALDAYEDLEPADRVEFESRIWWLADPLVMVPGNERRTEHFSRHVLGRLQPGAESPYGVVWGRDLEELLVRYGWPSGWSRRRQPIYSAAAQRPPITGHDPARSFRFVPPEELVDDYTSLEAVEWDLQPRHPREEYLPSYSRAFDGRGDGFDHQLAVFRRGGAALLVGAYEWMSDSLPPRTPLRVGLVYATERGESDAAISEGAPRRGVLTARAPMRAGMLGIEALADSAGRAARARIGRRLAPAAGPSLSDILLLDPPATVAPSSLEEALQHVRSSTTVTAGDRVGLLWEVYGVPEGARLQVQVSLTKPGKGLFRRAAEWLGLARDRDPTVSPPPATSNCRSPSFRKGGMS
jgi:hypothetical protein